MRLDKYLKLSRLIKRRTVANEACDAGRVSVNGRVVKASYDVKVGDEIEIGFGNRAVKVRVTDVKEVVRKEEAGDMFEYLDPYAEMFGEMSSISKKEGRLEGYAKDPITSGLAPAMASTSAANIPAGPKPATTGLCRRAQGGIS